MPRARLARRLACVGAAVAVAVTLAACSPTVAQPPSDAASDAAPEGLTVSIKQGRLDVVGGRLVVRFEHDGDEALTIEGFTVRTPTLAPGLERSKPVELGPHDAIDVRLDLPPSVCDAEPGPVTVALRFRTTGDTSGAELTAADPFDTVARVNAADCLAASVVDVAAIVMPEHLRSTGTGAERRAFIDVDIVPAASVGPAQESAGEPSMRISRVYGTTLLNAEDGIDWTLGTEVAAGDAPFTVTLPVRPARCDAHAIADDKRGTILPFEIETSDGRAGRLDVPAGDVLKAELYAYYGERCRLDEPIAG